METPDTPFPGPWSDVRHLVRAELAAYLRTAARPELRTAPSRCAPWNGDQLTAHLAETFARFTRMLVQSRQGDLTAPFTPEELDAENHRAVDEFTGDPLAALDAEARGFCDLATDPEELMAHQFGPIAVGLQMRFGLADLAIHHDDIVVGAGAHYEPPPEVVDTLATDWQSAFGFDAGTGDERWRALLAASGR